jgi:CRISPR/Cas system-associated exonuclease Cas4 (RecB family)
VLEDLVKEGDLQTDVWRTTIESRFAEEIVAQEQAVGGPLRGARLAGARLRKVAERMSDLLRGIPADAVLPEQELEAADGRLWGTVDLIVRAETTHLIADYKTGSTLEATTGDIKERYRRQLMLYACLEEAADSWPDSATIIPFGSAPLSIEVEPDECRQVLENVLATLQLWETWVGGVPPANPAPDACSWCPYAARCSAFWDACDPSWDSNVSAAKGVAETVNSSPLGGVTFTLDSVGGTVLGPMTVRNVDPDEHPALALATPGDQVSVVGLRSNPREEAHTLRPGARVRVTS